MVKLLLTVENIHIDAIDSLGETALSMATARLRWALKEDDCEAVIKLLLATGRANVNARRSDGKTPLSIAFEDRHDDIAKLMQSSVPIP
jgi:ankyrin repeat protein